jgi:hypothetical protein
MLFAAFRPQEIKKVTASDRSEAQWRDLRLFKLIQCFRMGAVRQVKDFFQFLGKVQQEMKLSLTCRVNRGAIHYSVAPRTC